MEIKEAFGVVDRVCAAFTGNRQDHINITEALRVVNDFINKPYEEPKKEKK